MEADQNHVPITALTAFAMPEDKNKCLLVGMDDIINKPIKIEQLEHIFRKYIPDVPADNNIMKSFYQDTVNLFIKESGFEPESGSEFINDFYESSIILLPKLRRTIRENNLKEAGILIHKLKGSASTVRAIKIVELAVNSEKMIQENNVEELEVIIKQLELWVAALKNPKE